VWRQLSVPLISIASLKWNGGSPPPTDSDSDSDTEERSAKRIKVSDYYGYQWVSIDPVSEWFKHSMNTLKCLNSFSNIRSLSVRTSYIVDVEPLKYLPYLRTLNISDNPVTSLEPLRDTRTLRVLNMYNTAVKTLEPLRNNSDLELLDISVTPIDSLMTLQYFPNLRILLCEDCRKIPSLDGVNFAAKLQVLYMQNMTREGFSLSPLESLSELQVLDCSHCYNLTSQESLLKCTALVYADVSYTHLSFDGVDHLCPIGKQEYHPFNMWRAAQNVIDPGVNNRRGFDLL
jgi:Leucine-rich repeat (LRR) protein